MTNPGEGFNLRRDVFMRIAIMVKQLNQKSDKIYTLVKKFTHIDNKIYTLVKNLRYSGDLKVRLVLY